MQLVLSDLSWQVHINNKANRTWLKWSVDSVLISPRKRVWTGVSTADGSAHVYVSAVCGEAFQQSTNSKHYWEGPACTHTYTPRGAFRSLVRSFRWNSDSCKSLIDWTSHWLFIVHKNCRVTELSNNFNSATHKGGGTEVVQNDWVMIFCFSHRKERKIVETPGHCRSCCWFWEEAPNRPRPIMAALNHMHLHGRAKNTVNSWAGLEKRSSSVDCWFLLTA